jgi:hypothetical protein
VKCGKHRTDGQPCGAQAVDGTDACIRHAGRPTAEHKARGAIVTEVRRWNVGDVAEDPGTLLLRLMTVSEWNRQAYEAEIDRILTATDLHLSDALVAETLVLDKEGHTHVVGEYIRGIVTLEAQERDRAANLAVKALAAGIAERQVRIAEQQGVLVARVLRDALTALGHDPTDPNVRQVMVTHLRALTGGEAVA